MRCVTRVIGCAVTLLLGCANRGETDLAVEEFAGTTPSEAAVRDFIGGLARNAACHSVAWRVTLAGDKTFFLRALYHVPARDNPNQSEDGPTVKLHGRWKKLRGAKFNPQAVVYQLNVEQPTRTLSFVKINESLLHLLSADGSLAVGNGGSSYTLNGVRAAEKSVDRSLAMSAPDMSYKIAPLATGSGVFGVFEGRSPCHGISRELKLPQHAGCMKAKWRVTLYQDSQTFTPTTYRVEGTLFRPAAREGRWSIVRGVVATDPQAVVYQLNATETQPALLLLKGDDNVLFFLNQRRELLVGHEEFSYTLNRREK